MLTIGKLREAQRQFKSVRDRLLDDSSVGLDLSPPVGLLDRDTIYTIEQCLALFVKAADDNPTMYPDTREID